MNYPTNIEGIRDEKQINQKYDDENLRCATQSLTICRVITRREDRDANRKVEDRDDPIWRKWERLSEGRAAKRNLVSALLENWRKILSPRGARISLARLNSISVWA